VLTSGSPAAPILRALRSFLGDSDLMAYLAMMAVRLVEMRRVLKETGSLYLHCDPTASHYLKILLDGIFGANRFLNEIIWRRTNARGTTGRWPRIHDVILHYANGRRFTFNPQKTKADKAKLPHTLITGPDGRKYQTYELTAPGTTKDGDSGKPWRGYDPNEYGRHWGNSQTVRDAWDTEGLIHWPKDGGFPRRRGKEPFDPESRQVTVGDVWTDIDRLNQAAKERLGYPTQKPLALLERIIAASSNPGDFILDPFCGCGTTVHAAQKLGRQWTGIDVTHYAITVVENRLRKEFPDLGEILFGGGHGISTPHATSPGATSTSSSGGRTGLWVCRAIANVRRAPTEASTVRSSSATAHGGPAA
jgi:DNA modification methylase